ncbi:HNH endonuclease [Nocardioides marmoriginsengisoli]|uniref:HNH endonuclease n=1 Tax=Nocardioides marmoriginsengisoli TaxID=661483 RepID=A0A3N0CBT9_9ACTN|nr:HNH endonuclease signature motif containing protein [Nocardioides marmoriginsengisoli]RNL60721.1 HNH endonuclease [Nocardioides marmoriginsengisoli]
MTLLALPETTTDPVAALHACIDRLADLDPDEFGAQAKTALLQKLGQAEARIAAVELRVLGAAHRAEVATSSGLATTDQWAARATNSDPVVLHREVRLSQQLEHRSATQEALLAGHLSAAHAAVIVRAVDQLPPSVDAAQRTTVESALVAKALTMPPGALRRSARRGLAEIEADHRIVDAHEDDLVAAEERAARARTRLTLHDNEDGTVTGHFTVPRLHGHLLRKVLQTITAPRRGRLGASQAQVGTDVGLRTDWDRARGSAFCELIEHLPTDHLHPRTAATVVVSLDESTLRGALAVAHLDTDADLSAGEARRLACGAGLVPVVLGGASIPLDLGRSARLFSESQRIALGLRHRTCAAAACDRPFAWCELHHLNPWSRGGRTDLSAAVPVCHFHHQRMHDKDYEHRRDPDGSITFHQRT